MQALRHEQVDILRRTGKNITRLRLATHRTQLHCTTDVFGRNWPRNRWGRIENGMLTNVGLLETCAIAEYFETGIEHLVGMPAPEAHAQQITHSSTIHEMLRILSTMDEEQRQLCVRFCKSVQDDSMVFH